MSTYVVVGGGLAGAKAVETLRAEGFDGDVVLVASESERPYERPPLSKNYLQGKAERATVFVHDEGWYAEHGVDLRLGATAVGLDPSAQQLTFLDGAPITYDRLLLATGCAPRALDVPGADGAHVLMLRELGESDRLREAFAAGGRLVVIGGGWIGLEVAAAAREADLEVTVVEFAEQPLLRVLGAEVARVVADLHRAHGVDLRLGVGVAEIRPDSVVTSAGDVLAADAVVVGVGVAPVTALAASGGLAIDNGIVVDAGLRTSSPDVFAAGDVASAFHPRYGRHLRTEHWANALNGGPAAARAMLGHEVTYDRLPYFYTDQYDFGMEYVGWADAAASQVVLRGDVTGRSFQAFWLVDGIVEAAMHANLWDDGADPLKAVVSLNRPVDPARLADPSVPLSDL